MTSSDTSLRSQELSRRDALALSASLVAAGLIANGGSQQSQLEAAEEKGSDLPIIDCHQHLWDLTKFELAWLKPDSILNKSFLPVNYVAAAHGLGIEQTVYMEVDVVEKHQQAEADYLIDLCKNGKTLTKSAVISGRPGSAGFEKYIRQFANEPLIKGVRQVLHSDNAPAGTCLQEQFVKSMKLLGELDKSFDLCMRPSELGDAVKLVEQCPGTRFILDHCGNGDMQAFLPEKRQTQKPNHEVAQWKADIERLAKLPNIICKISGAIARAPKDWTVDDLAPVINHCLDAFGPDRVIFGSDWPVCLLGATYREWVTALKKIVASRPIADQKKLFSENARKFYKLS